jgi:hypothetical protein
MLLEEDDHTSLTLGVHELLEFPDISDQTEVRKVRKAKRKTSKREDTRAIENIMLGKLDSNNITTFVE